MCQGRRKHLQLGGGTTLQGQFSPKTKGEFSRNKEGTSLFIGKSWGHVPPVPPVPPGPTSMPCLLSNFGCYKVLYLFCSLFFNHWMNNDTYTVNSN